MIPKPAGVSRNSSVTDHILSAVFSHPTTTPSTRTRSLVPQISRVIASVVPGSNCHRDGKDIPLSQNRIGSPFSHA